MGKGDKRSRCGVVREGMGEGRKRRMEETGDGEGGKAEREGEMSEVGAGKSSGWGMEKRIKDRREKGMAEGRQGRGKWEKR